MGMGYMMGWMLIGLVVIGFLVVVAAVLTIRYLGSKTTGEKRKNTAESILNERLARGEITPDEYRERLNMLHHP